MILLLPFLLSGTALMAQQGFGTNAPDPSSVVHMEANNKGLLIPRVELKATNVSAPVSSPAPYLLVFNTANVTDKGAYNVTPGFYFWNDTTPAGWVRLLDVGDLSAVSGWSMKGNAADATSFLGTDKDLVFKTGGIERMRFTDYGSVGVGTGSPSAAVGLELQSTSQGFLPPRMSEDQMNSISNKTGLIVYNITRNCLAYYSPSSGAFKCFSDKLAAAKAAALNSTLPQKGSTFTRFYNGVLKGDYDTKTFGEDGYIITHYYGESFAGNTTCADKLISAHGCDGLTTVRGASGYDYPLVNINGQCWMTENLHEKPTKAPYKDYTVSDWDNTDNGYWGYHNPSSDKKFASSPYTTKYGPGPGLLYQWSAAMNGSTAERAQGVCPEGFHVPSDCEFMYLEHGLGLFLSEQQVIQTVAKRANFSSPSRDPRIYDKLEFSNSSNNNGWKNVTGFSGVYAGWRQPGGSFVRDNEADWWWTSTASGSDHAYYREIYFKNEGVERDYYPKAYAASVRCLKD